MSNYFETDVDVETSVKVTMEVTVEDEDGNDLDFEIEDCGGDLCITVDMSSYVDEVRDELKDDEDFKLELARGFAEELRHGSGPKCLVEAARVGFVDEAERRVVQKVLSDGDFLLAAVTRYMKAAIRREQTERLATPAIPATTPSTDEDAVFWAGV